jgi:hypothetical protein
MKYVWLFEKIYITRKQCAKITIDRYKPMLPSVSTKVREHTTKPKSS